MELENSSASKDLLIYLAIAFEALTKGDNSGGYRETGLKLLSKHSILAGDNIKIATEDGEMVGILMPRYESASEEYIVIKLNSGYNTGIHVDKIKSITKLLRKGEQSAASTITPAVPANENLPKVAFISTGGTIASKIDYRTGGVHAALSAAELYASVPELANHASIDPELLLNEYSENLRPEHWTLIAEKVAEKIKTGRYRGIVVSHGTDTMHYTAAALSFALRNLPVPVVLVGAQRSSDRPSSDAALNLLGATIFATKSEYAGVFVAMHRGISDDTIACHMGTRVRKNHTSRRDAFESIDVNPVALVSNNEIEMQKNPIKLVKRSSANLLLERTRFHDRVVLLKYYPGFDPTLIEHAIKEDYRAIILEGTGLGHVGKACFPALKKAVDAGLVVCMTSQCIWGRMSMKVYDTGRDLLEIGVIPLSDMISETATVKAMWALANSKDVEVAKKIMQENLANEISSSLPIS